MAKRRQDNSPAGRLMRQAGAYARLAAKAHHAGNRTEQARYQERYIELRARALRMRDREANRRA